jgi:hypothetical protein
MLFNDAPDFIRVPLTRRQVAMAQRAGELRQKEAEENRRVMGHAEEAQPDFDPLACNLMGTFSECAFSVFSGIRWDPLLDQLQDEEGRNYPDVGPFEVRGARSHDRRLILHKPWSPQNKGGDHPDRPYVLVTGEPPNDLAIRGWILGKDGMNDDWWEDPVGGRPAFFVPHKPMLPMRTGLVRYHQKWLERLTSP